MFRKEIHIMLLLDRSIFRSLLHFDVLFLILFWGFRTDIGVCDLNELLAPELFGRKFI